MTINKIAFCTDFSENAETAFEQAIDIAKQYDAKIFIIHILPPVLNPLMTDVEWVMPQESTKTLILKLEEKMRQVYGNKIEDGIEYNMVVKAGHVSSEIINYLEQEDIDLVVMGAYGLTGMELVLFGSVAKRVAHKAPCSVMIVRDKNE